MFSRGVVRGYYGAQGPYVPTCIRLLHEATHKSKLVPRRELVCMPAVAVTVAHVRGYGNGDGPS